MLQSVQFILQWAHAREITPNSELQTGANGKPDSNTSETEPKTVTRTIKYVDASDESKEVARTVTQTATVTRTNKVTPTGDIVEEGTWTTGKWEAQTSPKVDGYSDPNQSSVDAKEVTSTTENDVVTVYYTKRDASSTSTTRKWI